MDATAERTAPEEGPEPGSTGDPGGLSALYVRCMPEAVGLAYLLTGDDELARDIADEAFVRGAGRFEHRLGRVRFPSWLRRSVVTVFLLRERRAELEAAAEPEPAGVERAEPRADDIAKSGGDAADGGADDGVWPAVLALPSRERAAVVLRHCRGLSEDEAAAALRCSVRTTRIMVTRGVELLGNLVGEP